MDFDSEHSNKNIPCNQNGETDAGSFDDVGAVKQTRD